ncbi:MAG: WD40 repeat domain-containing protein, partial [Bradyrhizobium sp.]
PDGQFVLTAGSDGVVKLWDAESGDLLDSFMAHDGAIQWNAAGFSPDGEDIFSRGRDGVVRLWPMRYETRDAATLAHLLDCRVAWRIADSTLVPHEIDMPTCAAVH